MLQRLAQAPDIDRRDLSSLDGVQQGAGSLPVWLGRRWCELVGPEHFYVTYGASERHGYVCCRGDEWLAHPGTVGRGYMGTDHRPTGDDGTVLGAGEVGGDLHAPALGARSHVHGVGKAEPMVTRPTTGSSPWATWVVGRRRLPLRGRPPRSDTIVYRGGQRLPGRGRRRRRASTPASPTSSSSGWRDPEWGRRVHAIVWPAG